LKRSARRFFYPEDGGTIWEEIHTLWINGLMAQKRSCRVTSGLAPNTAKMHWLKLNSVASVRKRTIPTERPPLVGDVSDIFLRIEGVAWSAQRILKAVNLGFLDLEPLLFYSSSFYTHEAEWTLFQTH
jgi:hypothetical protein